MVTIAILPDYFKDKTLNSMIHYLELDCDDIKTEYKTSTGCSYLLYKEKKYLGEINISDGLDKIIFRIDKTGDY